MLWCAQLRWTASYVDGVGLGRVGYDRARQGDVRCDELGIHEDECELIGM